MRPESTRPNPYVGLRPFGSADSLYFFGRRAQVVDLLHRLHETRFLGVVGSSGCGKSSLILAGLIPALLGGFLVEDRDRWLVAAMKPGGGPIRNLARALASMGGREPKEEEVRELEAAIVEYHGQAALEYLKPQLASDANLLLLLDQFEEIFTFRGTAQEEQDLEIEGSERQEFLRRQREAADFVDLVLALAEQRDLPIYVVLTMRSDFLGDCDLFYGLPEAMNLSRYLVPRLNRGQLREAIEGPPMLVGERLARRLVDALLNELGDRSDRLPILEHALMRTWDFWQRAGASGPIDREHYEAVGTLREALPRHASEALREADLPATAAIFRRLTDTDASHRRVRRAAPVSELVAVAGVERHVVEAILQRFNEDGRNFLHISPGADPDDSQVEISHESLIRQWDQLSRWVDEEREARDQFLELVERARGGRALLRDPDLQIALGWRAAVDQIDAWAERYSSAPDDIAVALDYLERSRLAKVEAESRRRRNRNLVVTASVVVGLALAALSLWALENAARAQDTARVAIASKWLDKDPTRAALLLLGVESPAQTRYAAPTMRELLGHRIAARVLHHGGRVGTVAFSPDGSQIATGSDDGTAWVWTIDGPGESVPLRGHTGWVRTVAFSPDGARVATASLDGTARVWNADGSGEPVVLRGHQGSVQTAVFSPDGAHIVTASSDETARVWRSDGSGEPVVLGGHDGSVESAAFSPDGSRIVTASLDGVARLWDVGSSREPRVFEGHLGGLVRAAFSPDGRSIVTASSDGTARVWLTDGSGEPAVLGRRSTTSLFTLVEHADFSPDGSQVLTTRNDGTIRVWNADGSGDPVLFRGPHVSRQRIQQTLFATAAFSPDSSQLIAGFSDATAHVWNVDGESEPLILRGHDRPVVAVAFSPDGRWIATGSHDGTARVWSTTTPADPVLLRGHDDWVVAAVFSPDGSRIATGSDDGTARVWNADGTGDSLALRHESRVGTVVFSPDGGRIATGSDDGTARLWRADGSGHPVVLRGHAGSVQMVAFRPDGRSVVTASDDRTARVWNVDGSGEAVVLRGHGGSVQTAVFSPDGARIATASSDGTARVWAADGSGDPVVLSGHERLVGAAFFSPDGTRIVTTSDDGTARLWNSDGAGEPVILEHAGWVGWAAFSSDGSRIVTASDDGTARVWTTDASRAPVVLQHDGRVGMAAFSPDGVWIVTGSGDGTARVWNAAGSGEPLVLHGHHGRLTQVAFSPGGGRVVTASTDGTARVWAYGAERLQQAIAVQTQGCLDADFRANYLNESPAQALRRFEACEHSPGRAP